MIFEDIEAEQKDAYKKHFTGVSALAPLDGVPVIYDKDVPRGTAYLLNNGLMIFGTQEPKVVWWRRLYRWAYRKAAFFGYRGHR